jgi:hypothetical protein
MNKLSLHCQINIRKIKAQLIKTRMITLSSLFEKLISFMHQTLCVNNALIRQQIKLYQLANINQDKADYFLNKADKIKVLNAKQSINIVSQKIKDLNLENLQEMKYLELKLVEILRITDRDDSSRAIAKY